MTTARDLFQKDKQLREQLAAVLHSDWFEHALLYARSAFLESSPTTEELSGAMKFQAALMGLCADADPVFKYPESGLIHNLDNPRGEINHETPK